MLRPGGHVFRGWYIAIGAAGIQLLAGMLWMHSYGAYTVLLQEEFGWSSFIVGLAFALTRVESGILGPLQGWLVDRFGPRPVLRVGTLIFGGGFILFATVDSVVTFFITFALIAVGSSLGGFATLMVAIVNWFNRHLAKAVAVSQLGFGLGGLCVPVVILMLELFGWRATAVISGIFVMAVGLPLIQIVHHRPADIGELPDGGAPPHADGKAPPIRDDFTARQAMRTSAFWLISIAHAMALLTVSTVMVHLVPHLTRELSFTLTEAGLVVALMTGCQMGGQLLGGWLGDNLPKRLVCVGCMLGHASGFFLLAFATNVWMVVGFALLHGTGWGARGPLMVALRADYFGAASFGTIMGFSSLIAMLGMALGPTIAGAMADVQGNFTGGFALLAVGSLVGAVCFFAAKRPNLPTRV